MIDQIRTDLDWEDIRTFIMLSRRGSLSATARAMSVSHVTVSRRVHALEQALGQKLVERRPDGYVLTPAGTDFLGPASEMEAAALKLGRPSEDEALIGVVRVNAPPSLTQRFLARHLAALTHTHPALDIELSSDFRNVSLERRETDIALRYGKPLDGAVLAKHLVNVGFGFYGSAKWAERLEDGGPLSFIGFDEANFHLPEASWMSQHFPRARAAFRADGHLTQAMAACAGAGIALLPHFLAREFSELRRCRLDQRPPSRELWLLTRRLGVHDVTTRLVVDFLMKVFAAERNQFDDVQTS